MSVSREYSTKATLKLLFAIIMGVIGLTAPASAGDIFITPINSPVRSLPILGLNVVFQGGTLLLDINGQSYSQNFTFDTTGTIDIGGVSSTFGGAGTVSGGQATITNLVGGGSLTFLNSNTYSGGTLSVFRWFGTYLIF